MKKGYKNFPAINLRIKKLIEDSKMTRKQIAKKVGCGTSTVTKHYNGNSGVSMDTLKKYANTFDVSTDSLIGDNENFSVKNNQNGEASYDAVLETQARKLKIKTLIDGSNITRPEIAKLLGCTHSTVTKHYNGTNNISTKHIREYAKLFNVSTDYLIWNQIKYATENEQACDSAIYTGLNMQSIKYLHNTKFSIIRETLDFLLLPEIKDSFQMFCYNLDILKDIIQSKNEENKALQKLKKAGFDFDNECEAIRAAHRYIKLRENQAVKEYEIQSFVHGLIDVYCKEEKNEEKLLEKTDNGFIFNLLRQIRDYNKAHPDEAEQKPKTLVSEYLIGIYSGEGYNMRDEDIAKKYIRTEIAAFTEKVRNAIYEYFGKEKALDFFSNYNFIYSDDNKGDLDGSDSEEKQ